MITIVILLAIYFMYTQSQENNKKRDISKEKSWLAPRKFKK